MMETTDFENNWSSWKEKIKAAHPDLTDEDLTYKQGKEADLVLRLAEKTNRTKEEIYDWLRIMG